MSYLSHVNNVLTNKKLRPPIVGFSAYAHLKSRMMTFQRYLPNTAFHSLALLQYLNRLVQSNIIGRVSELISFWRATDGQF